MNRRALIDEVTADEPEGMAAWARALLLGAARASGPRAKVTTGIRHRNFLWRQLQTKETTEPGRFGLYGTSALS